MFLSPYYLNNNTLCLCTKTSVIYWYAIKVGTGRNLPLLEKLDKERKVHTELWFFVAVVKQPQYIMHEAGWGNPGQENTTLWKWKIQFMPECFSMWLCTLG